MPEIPCEKLFINIVEITGTLGRRRRVHRVLRWAGIKLGDTCEEFEKGFLYPGKTIQAGGTFGGGSIELQGRVTTDLTAQPLQDVAGFPVAFSASGDPIQEVRQNVARLIPVLAGGDGTTNLTILIGLV